MRVVLTALTVLLITGMFSGCKKSGSTIPGTNILVPYDSGANEFNRRDTSLYGFNRILVDASKDGGTWWFPQSPLTGFSSKEDHQGSALVQYLVSLGYQVDELPRDTVLTSSMLTKYSNIIRAVGFSGYTWEELQAYDDFLNNGGSLLLIADFLRGSEADGLAEHLGLQLRGMINGTVTIFASDSITDGVTPLAYIAGSVAINTANNHNITVLGSFDKTYYLDVNNNGIYDSGDLQAPPAMGKLNNYPGKIFFIGDINGLESVPQPLTKNLVHWLFK